MVSLKKVQKMRNRYAIEIFYSQEDSGFIAVVPELPGCSAYGKTEEEALKEIKIAMDLWIETAKKEGFKIPKPKSKALLKDLMSKKGIQISHSIHKA
jgi:predicted RNase H-like HicB family nuclease